MADREVHTHTSGGTSGIGIAGVVIGAIIVLGAIYLFAGNVDWAGNDGAKTDITVQTPSAPGGSSGTTGGGGGGGAAPGTPGSGPSR